jgi:hypothetical protein
MSKNRMMQTMLGAVENEGKPNHTSNFDFYVNLPENWDFFKPFSSRPEDCTAENGEVWIMEVDIFPYTVQNTHHMERDDAKGIALPDTEYIRNLFYVHNNVGKGKEICLRSQGMPCPICDYYFENTKGVDWDSVPQEMKNVKGKARNLYIVQPKNDNVHEDKPHIWEVSYHTFTKMLTESLKKENKKTEKRSKGKEHVSPYNGFADFEDGYTVELTFTTDTWNKKEFAKLVSVGFLDREEQYNWDLLDTVPDLDSLLKVKSYEELKNKFYGNEEPEAEEPAKTQETPSKRKPKKLDAENPCPHGYKYGEDWDEQKECESCVKYDACGEL